VAEWFNSLRLRVRALLRPRHHDRDLQDELAFHLAMREEHLQETGTTDAGRTARRRFGNLTRIREELRETWALAPAAGALVRDLRYAARILRRSPVFTLVVIVTLGLGIGANTAFFTVVNAVLIRPLGYADADRLVSLSEGFPQAGIDHLLFSALDYDDFRRYQQSFERVGAYRNVPFELSGDGPPERIAGTKVSAGLFDVLGVAPIAGRTFAAEEDRPGMNVAVLSWGLWQRRYGGDPSILGRSIQLDRQAYTVVGIMPAAFVFPRRGPYFNGEPADLWIPIAFTDRERVERGSMHANSVIGRLKPGISLEAAAAELELLSRRIAENYPPIVLNAGFSPRLSARPYREEISGRFEEPLLLLLGAVGLILIIACANVANLVLSRVAVRTREFAVRTALGARRAQLLQLLLCEALLLAAAGGMLGIAIAQAAVTAAPVVLTRTVPGLHDLSVDLRVLVFTAAIALATAVLFALLPLPMLDRRNPADPLREDASRSTEGVRKLAVQRGFVVVTVALACVLLVGAGLFIRSFATLTASEIGFQPARVLTASVTLPTTFYRTGSSVKNFQESLTRSLSALPGVRTVAMATDLPLTTYEVRAFTPEGGTWTGSSQPTTNVTWVHGPYFETLGITLRHGRFFTEDEHRHDRRVAIVNEKLARIAWSGQDPIGRRMKWGPPASAAPWLTVVGVIGDVADGPVGAEPRVHAYEPFRQFPDFFLDGSPNQFGRDLKVAMLAAGEPGGLAALLRETVAGLDPVLAVERIQSMEDQVGEVVAPQRFTTLLVAGFAAMALLLASVGLYGVLAFATARRQKEIAVRIALGAERHAVLHMVIGQGIRLVAIGLIAGLVASLGVVRAVTSLLYQPDPYDPLTFAVVPVVLAAAGFAACAVPAWRAARVPPTAALRID
jgi:predicted permease